VSTHREADVLGQRALRDVGERLVGTPALQVLSPLALRPGALILAGVGGGTGRWAVLLPLQNATTAVRTNPFHRTAFFEICTDTITKIVSVPCYRHTFMKQFL
jgi:hypothetical protein